MATMQIRNVPDEVRIVMKRRAAEAGQSLSEYLLGEITRLADQPTMAEVAERIAKLGRSELPSAAAILAQERGSC